MFGDIRDPSRPRRRHHHHPTTVRQRDDFTSTLRAGPGTYGMCEWMPRCRSEAVVTATAFFKWRHLCEEGAYIRVHRRDYENKLLIARYI